MVEIDKNFIEKTPDGNISWRGTAEKIYEQYINIQKKEQKKDNIKKKNTNLIIAMSDMHWGHESCLYETFWYCVDELCEDIKMLKTRHDFNRVVLATVGDIVSGTQIYRNQYIESHMQKDGDIISFAAYMLHLVIKRIEQVTGCEVFTYIVSGTHEGLMRAFSHNFGLGVSRRLFSYGHSCRYASKYYIIDLAYGLTNPQFNILFYHGYGGADYSSASPSLVRELTTTHSQFATQRGIIIRRFCIGHSHWLEPYRTVLGIRYDCLGGFMRWDKKISQRDSGLLYYTLTEEGEFRVYPIYGTAKQLEESGRQELHVLNMRKVADILYETYDFEIERGILIEESKNYTNNGQNK